MTVPRPGEVMRVKALGVEAGLLECPIRSVQLLGGPEIASRQEADALALTCPEAMPQRQAVGFKLSF